MYDFLPWPYAAKASILHEFDTDHLNIWLTFKLAMEINHTDPDTGLQVPTKPANDKWLVKVDNVTMPVSDSQWQDSWTMLLTVPNISALPDRILVEYLGPDPNLCIAWKKQWEPWGPILSLNITS